MKYWINITIVLVILIPKPSVSSVNKCPVQCECELIDNLKKVSCIQRNIVDMNLDIPKNVQIIDVSYNRFNQLVGSTFKNLEFKSLINLNLSHNLINWIGLHAFKDLKNLQVLDLSYNRLEELDNELLFWYNKRLESLDLSGNKFINIKNQPFISHKTLKILNLSNSRIASLPDISFDKLPSLLKLDLSQNYMIQIQIKTLMPLSKLKILNLNNNEWHCNDVMKNTESWLIAKSIKYSSQCKIVKNMNKLEKMIMSEEPPKEREEIDIDELWGVENDTLPKLTIDVDDDRKINKSFIELYNEKVPPFFSLLIGLQIGVVLGILFTYCWMAKVYKCNRIKFRQLTTPNRRVNCRNEAGARLLTNASVEDCITPPTVRRQMQTAPPVCRSFSWQPRGFAANDNTNRPETPPPGYNDALNDIVLPCQ